VAARKGPRPPAIFAAVIIDPSESFETAARRIVPAQKAKTRGERLRRLEIYVFPALGPLPVSEIRGGHVRAVLEAALDALCRTSIGHVLDDIAGVFDQLWRDEVIPENPARKVKVPAGAREDDPDQCSVASRSREKQTANPFELQCQLVISCRNRPRPWTSPRTRQLNGLRKPRKVWGTMGAGMKKFSMPTSSARERCLSCSKVSIHE
jgi:hypothetical protein